MKRKLILLLVLLVAISAGIAPVSIAIWLAYRTTVHNAEANLNAIAQGIAEDTSKVLRDVDRGLIALADVSFACTPEDINVMNTMAYDIPEISEIGLMRPDHKLVCTSWGAIDPPVEPEIPEAPPGFSLMGPMEIKLMKRFGLIAMRQREDGSQIGAMLHPSILIGRLGAELGEHGFAVLVRREDTHLYAWNGNVPEMEMVESETEEGNGTTRLRALFRDGIERTLSAVELEGYPGIYSVVAVSDAWILNDWKRMALILGVIGAGTSVVLLILVAGILRRRLSLQGELESSLLKDEFEINYQPVVDLKAGRCVGAEALISWVQPGGTRVRPDLFIPLAEDTGLIEPLTEWLMKALRNEMEELLGSDRSLHVAINLSPCHFETDRILHTSSHYFGDSQIMPSQIIYEITERGLIEENNGVAREVMTKLRARKSHIAVDDFGTGYSSLGYISSFPLDYLKIDKRFVDAIGTDAPMAGLVDSIIDMAKRLDLRIIAEGVETSEQADYLKEQDVDYAQGWYYSRSVPAAEFIAFVQEFNNPRTHRMTG
jgi:sensor c-di-GMP phosphodiesterase-like protein